ncbi:Purple acid Phosphatase, N-terminal domain [Selenomonas ruminantium]|uniref:Purple acid Phosphatase, N-terminal domain n=1 Tax=Selenomonas ruminantium TaxID=971 RepID=A0A1M6U3X8_SELRU|nr:metallophosphoesterase family protein [Selenomonas ruminantium]SHK63768.1 Purple acid Phosphatase, N-terminal domain [Selenomonas ruminantium]
MQLSRRNFLILSGKIILLLGLGGFFPRLAAAASGTLPIEALRQLITSDPRTSRTIMWQSKTPLDECRLQYQAGNAPMESLPVSCNSLNEDRVTNYYYTAWLKDLIPATTYRYRIWQGNISTDWHEFSTAPADITDFSALIFCDSQCGHTYDSWGNAFRTAWQRHADAHFFAIVGDLVDNGQQEWQWQHFFAAIQGILPQHLFVPVMGNHECYSLIWKFCRPRRYELSYNLPANGSPELQNYFYSYDYGPVHFIVLNTQMLELKDIHPDILDKQKAWLRQDAKNHHAKWQVVLMHKDILAYDEYQEVSKTMMSISDAGHAFMPIFDELGIDLVLTGHMHTYRNRGHIRHLEPADKGPVYIMSGPIGNQQYTVPADKKFDRSAIYQPTPENYLLLRASNEKLSVTCYTVNGEFVETYEISK